MRLINNFFFHIGQGVKGIFRNPVMSTASLLVLVCCMVVTGTFALIIDNINKKASILTLTASATPKVQQDIVKNLKMEKANLFISSFNSYFFARLRSHTHRRACIQ